MKRWRARRVTELTAPVQVLLDSNVVSYIRDELAKCPEVEEGGKYVGYALSGADPRLRSLSLDPTTSAIVVTDFLPSGPNATRTAVELLPDGEYQERLFRQLERVDPAIEHVGTWHSHHCNGLQTLSSGDVEGYIRTVNRAEYRLDYFLASLVTRLPQHADDTGWIDHFLFVKGKDEYSRITDSIKIVEWPTDFAALINHSVQGRSGKSRIRGEDRTRPIPEQTSTVWYETPEGREILAEDRRFFRESFKEDVRVTRRGRSITMTGLLGSVAISMTYPSDPEELQVAVSVSQQGVVILQIGSDLRWRRLALTAALAAAAPLRRPQ